MSEYTPADYARANQLTARLAMKHDPTLVTEARTLAAKLIEHVKSQLPDYAGFVERVRISEQFSLTESRQPEKVEKQMKVIYERAQSLLETAEEAEARAKKRAG